MITKPLREQEASYSSSSFHFQKKKKNEMQVSLPMSFAHRPQVISQALKTLE